LELFGIEEVMKLPDITIYGTRVFKKEKRFFVGSGRLFHLVARGKTVIDARRRAYEAMSLLHIGGNNLHYRTDIGWRDLQRLANSV
jgi:phosphoribosylamine--glycine ligase